MTDAFSETIDGRALGTFTAAELQGQEFPPIRWIVPEVLPEGLTILAGKPKLGKSWFALDVALAVANGGSVLGRECEQGPTLYLALEDTRAANFAAIKTGNTVAGQIIRETGLNDNLVYQTLRRMMRAGELRKDGRGFYAIPSDPLSEVSECQKAASYSDNLTDLAGVSRGNGHDPDAGNPEAWK